MNIGLIVLFLLCLITLGLIIKVVLKKKLKSIDGFAGIVDHDSDNVIRKI